MPDTLLPPARGAQERGGRGAGGSKVSGTVLLAGGPAAVAVVVWSVLLSWIWTTWVFPAPRPFDERTYNQASFFDGVRCAMIADFAERHLRPGISEAEVVAALDRLDPHWHGRSPTSSMRKTTEWEVLVGWQSRFSDQVCLLQLRFDEHRRLVEARIGYGQS